MKNRAFLIFFFGIVLILASGCRSGQDIPGGIEVRDAWVRAIAGSMTSEEQPASQEGEGHMQPAGLNSAAYMIVKNLGTEADALLGVQFDGAEAVELHKSEMIDGVMTMRPVDRIEIPAGGEVQLKPGGLHIMLIGLKQDILVGEQIPLILVFEKAGEVELKAEAREP